LTAAQPTEDAAADAKTIAERFAAARAEARLLDRYPGEVPTNLEAAYRVQAAAIAQFSHEVRGWKVARIPPAFAAKFPDERLIGPAFARNVHWVRDGEIADCPVFAGGFAAVEAEVVIVVAVDTPAGKFDWTVDNVVDLVGSMHIGVEVASSPLPTLNDLGPGAVISDFGNNWGVVVGPEIRSWRTIDSIDVETFIDGASAGRGKVAIRTGPLSALAFTLNKRAQQGATLRAGDVISTGMITGVHDVRLGQRSRHVFDGCGEVRVHITRAVRLGG
jgi:2-keto-4-pentenoate hydratase